MLGLKLIVLPDLKTVGYVRSENDRVVTCGGIWEARSKTDKLPDLEVIRMPDRVDFACYLWF